VAVGFGSSQLKSTTNPLAAENRRVQIVNNIEQQTTVSRR
jgi:flagellar motor protein MotB